MVFLLIVTEGIISQAEQDSIRYESKRVNFVKPCGTLSLEIVRE